MSEPVQGRVDARLGLLLTVEQCALLARVRPSTVRTWHERGLLAPAGRLSSRGRPWLYRAGDVLAVERQTRHSDPTRRRARRAVD